MKNYPKGLFFLILLLMASILFLTTIAEGAKIKLRVNVESANIRLKPTIESTVISKAPLGAILESEEKVGSWYKVNLPPDESGFVVSGYIHESIVEVVGEIEEVPTKEKAEEERPPEVIKPVVLKPEVRQEMPIKTPFVKKPPAYHLISFKINTGLSYMIHGDINSVFQDLNDYYSDLNYYDEYYSYTLSDEWGKLHLGPNFEIDAIYNLSTNLGVGIGLEYIRGTKKDKTSLTVTYSSYYYDWTYRYDFDTDTKVSALPIKLNIYYTLPIMHGIKAVINGGLGYYSTKFKIDERIDEFYDGRHGDWVMSKIDVSGRSLGLQGGISFEYSLSKNLSLVFEGLGRYAKIKCLEGEQSYTEFDGDYKLFSGKLKFYKYHPTELPGKEYSRIGIDLPERYISDIRDASIDFSGLGFRVGIKISLF